VIITSNFLEFASRLQIEEVIIALLLGAEQRLGSSKAEAVAGRFES
jgi:hypothetical protein